MSKAIMRLINVHSLKFKEFLTDDGSQRPNYAILSHRWGDGESTYKDWLKGRNLDSPGHQKIVRFCALQLELCEWFTRGWTLQELLAPRYLCFCDADWRPFGHIGDGFNAKFANFLNPSGSASFDLVYTVSRITGIPPGNLRGQRESLCVAQKMSWASRRNTTRPEDTAYCLLGLFGVNMPLLYGEGSRAFRRLQEEIVKQSDDRSVLACEHREDLFADSPQGYREILRLADSQADLQKPPYTLTNIGLQMQDTLLLAIRDTTILTENVEYLLPLDGGISASRLQPLSETDEGRILRNEQISELYNDTAFHYIHTQSSYGTEVPTKRDMYELKKRDPQHIFKVFLALRRPLEPSEEPRSFPSKGTLMLEKIGL
ncbi:Vegetative incompatibility protein HET-E-1, partial [Pseudocercospora fuligena]